MLLKNYSKPAMICTYIHYDVKVRKKMKEKMLVDVSRLANEPACSVLTQRAINNITSLISHHQNTNGKAAQISRCILIYLNY